MLVDATRNNIQIPPSFIPYMEKHRIYELFYELARELIINQPRDHILFLKDMIQHAAIAKRVPRIVIIAPPFFNKVDLANLISQRTGSKVISLDNLINVSMVAITSHVLIKMLNKIIRTDLVQTSGWIFVDIPKTADIARVLQKKGILPTHIFQIIPSILPNDQKLLNAYEDYKSDLIGLKDAYKALITEVYQHDRTMDELATICANISSIRKRGKPPTIPRICLIGPRGSGHKKIISHILTHINVIHIDFKAYLAQIMCRKTPESEQLRNVLLEKDERRRIHIQLLENKLLEKECIDNGWILTGFPETLEDFYNFDKIQTPPNRVIIFECPIEVCRERITSRRVNIYNGNYVTVSDIKKHDLPESEYKIHPKDSEMQVREDLRIYFGNIEQIKEYCSNTAFYVNALMSLSAMVRYVEVIILNPVPDRPPRTPLEKHERRGSQLGDVNNKQIHFCHQIYEFIPNIQYSYIIC